MRDDVEVVVTDDASDEGQRVEEFIGNYGLSHKVIYVEPEDKKHINPCIPNNKAIAEATGEIIILQNPECFHTSDILLHAVNNLEENLYFSYACYSLAEEPTSRFTEFCSSKNYYDHMIDFCKSLPNKGTVQGETGWYNHSFHRPVGYNFLAALHKSNLDQLGGFDERYATGIGFDDDEFLFRVRLMGLDVQIIDEPFCFHQFHYGSSSFEQQAADDWNLFNINRTLFQKSTSQSKEWRLDQ